MAHRNENKPAFLVLVFALFLWVAKGRAEDRVDTVKLDWAYYNPVSLVLKEKGLPEEEFKKDGIKIEWTQSLGSNKALELLRSKSIDFGSNYVLFFRNKEWNSYGILNVRESFARDHPELVKRVLAVYEKARLWTLDHQSEARQILAAEAKLTDAVATKVWERTDFTNSAIGPIQRGTIRASGDILKQSQIIDPGTDIDRVVADLVDPEYFPSEVVNK